LTVPGIPPELVLRAAAKAEEAIRFILTCKFLRTQETKGRHSITLFGRLKESRFAHTIHLLEPSPKEQALSVQPAQ